MKGNDGDKLGRVLGCRYKYLSKVMCEVNKVIISEEKCSEEKGEGGSAYMQIRSEIG